MEGDLAIDFIGGAVGYRFRAGEGRDQALLKACGFKKGIVPTIVDATAGLGRDAFLLASHGACVTMIERSPRVHAALAAALDRARAAGGLYTEVAARLTLIHGDSKELLPSLSPEVILIDPMHPPRGKSALVKKEMRVLRGLVGDDADQADLLRAALAVARHRVVLKWPLRAPPMAGLRAPSHQILGKSTRYDVFMTAPDKQMEKYLSDV